MRLRQWLRTVLFTFALALLLVVPARAEMFFEGQIWGEEFEDGPGELGKLELFQTINDERFADQEEIILLFQLQLGSEPAIQEGTVRIRARVFKTDGSRLNPPMMSAEVTDNVARAQRSTGLALEKGDVIRWRVRFTGVPTVAQDGACQIIVGVANREVLE